MDNKELEVLLDIQKELKELKDKIDKIDYMMKDNFLTLEVAYEDNANYTNRVHIKVMKLEKRISELIKNGYK